MILLASSQLIASPRDEATLNLKGLTFGAVWDATVTALSRTLVVVSSDRSAGTLKAEAMAGMVPIGEVFEISVNPTAGGIDVRVVNVRRSRIQVVSLVPRIVDSIKSELGIADSPSPSD